MDDKSSDKILAFDTLFTTNSIQMLKVLISYLAPSAKKSIAIYIKFMELQYTISFFKTHPDASPWELPHETAPGTAEICEALLPFCDAAQKDKILQFKNMMQSFEHMQEMMEMVQMMKDLFPEGSDFGEGGADILSGLTGMSGMPDLSGFDLSQLMGMFGTTNEPK